MTGEGWEIIVPGIGSFRRTGRYGIKNNIFSFLNILESNDDFKEGALSHLDGFILLKLFDN